MSRISKQSVAKVDSNQVEVKSKFDAEFRRFSISREEASRYENFKELVEKLHRLSDIPFLISYTDPGDGYLLPINNDDNLGRALVTARPLLRVIIQRKGESLEDVGYGTFRPRNLISSILGTPGKSSKTYISISNPHNFRQVSAIIDVDLVPETCRRVKLIKYGSDRPLGFYIRDGTSVRVTSTGLERVPSIFISRLVPGGLAESTGLLAVGDEVLEVNGIEVMGRTLDQVTDMMLANSANLIITVKPANQRSLTAPRRGSFSRNSQLSSGSHQSTHSAVSTGAASAATTGSDEDRFDQDEIVDFTGVTLDESSGSSGGAPPSAPLTLNSTSVTSINTTVTTIGSDNNGSSNNNKEEAVLHL